MTAAGAITLTEPIGLEVSVVDHKDEVFIQYGTGATDFVSLGTW